MWWVGSKREVYLSRARVEMTGGPEALLPTVIESQDGLAGLDQLGVRGGLSRSATTVWLSGGLARPFILEPMSGLRNRSEAVLFAQAQAAELTGLSGACTVWLGEWRVGQPAWVTAIETRVLDSIQTWAQRHRIRLKGVRPWWADALRTRWSAVDAESLCCLSDDDALTVLSWDAQRQPCQAMSLSPHPQVAELQALLQRLQLSRDLAPTQVYQARRVSFFDSASGPRHRPSSVHTWTEVDQGCAA